MPLVTRATAVMSLAAVVFGTISVAAPAPAPAQGPVARFSFAPTSPFSGETVTFVSSSEGFTEERWGLDGDRICNDATGRTVQRSFPVAGAYQITLCVTDGVDQATQTRTVTVRNRPPVAAFTYAPGAPVRGQQIALTSFSADPDGPLMRHAWDLDGDGAFDDGEGSTASVTFPTAGDHLVQLLVFDRDGAGNVAARSIAVGEPAAHFITPFPVVRVVGKVGARGTRIREIVLRVPEGAHVEIRCSGRGCPHRARTRSARVARTMRVRRFAHRVLRPGAAVRIWVTKAEEIGKYTRFRIRRGKLPSRIDRCLPPNSRRPVRCGL
jgi:hypothetical protein